jgi:thiosulfate dehydrogenase [quinone] large subunit
MVGGFEATLLPEFLVLGFGYVLPFVEFGLGILLLLGFQTRKALIGAAIFMILFIFGSSLREEWGTVSTQMLYALFIFFLILYLEYNSFAIDRGRSSEKVKGYAPES